MALPKPLYVRYSILQIELLDPVTGEPTGVTYNYQCSATNIGLTSTGGDLTSLNTLCPDGSFSEAAPRTWSLDVTLVQDVESADSFLFFLMDNEGADAKVTWYPKTDNQGNAVGYGWTGTVKVALPASVGGVDIANWATTTVSLPFQGSPQRIDAEGNPVEPYTPPSVSTVALGDTVVDGEYDMLGDTGPGVRATPKAADGTDIPVSRVTAADWGNGQTNFDPNGGFIAHTYHEVQENVVITLTLDDGSTASSSPFDVVDSMAS